MRKAKIYLRAQWVGNLTEDENGYHFFYLTDYLQQPEAEAISISASVKPF